MNNIKSNIVCLLLATAAVCSGGGIACHLQSESTTSQTQPAASDSGAGTTLEEEQAGRARSFSTTPGATEAALDVQFIDTIIVHHKEATATVVVALVEAKATHGKLKEFVRNLRETFEGEIKQLSAWRTAWYGDVPPAINAKIINQVELTNALDVADLSEATGAEFDEMFFDMMWLHNHDAAQIAQAAQAQVARLELKQFAAKMLEARQAELMLLNQLRSEQRNH